MLAIMNQLRQKNVRNIAMSGFFPPYKGTTTSINDGLITRSGTTDDIWFEGDFNTTFGPTFSDLPFDLRSFSTLDSFRAHFKRTNMYGTAHAAWPNPANVSVLKDELTMFIVPKVVQPLAQDSNRTYNYTGHSGSYMPPFFKWSRTLMYRSADTYIYPYWSDWFLESNGDRSISARLVNISGAWRYLIDPTLSKNWTLPNFNPSYPIYVTAGANGVPFGLVMVNLFLPTAAGTPTVQFTGGSAAWTKAFSLTANKSARILIDGSAINLPIFLTGVTTP